MDKGRKGKLLLGGGLSKRGGVGASYQGRKFLSGTR